MYDRQAGMYVLSLMHKVTVRTHHVMTKRVQLIEGVGIMIEGTSRAVREVAAGVVPGRWSAAGKLPKATWLATNTAVALSDGKVLLAGGEDARRNARDEATVYDAAANAWTAVGDLNTTRRLHTLTRLQDGRVLAAGGISGPFSLPPAQLASAEIYDPSLPEAFTSSR
ncbi:kelch repeat-containing protein [Actinomadura fulvescens]|uniref:Kelch repeat-containing protein n=1 Tax=Actinomadura fulvescens TaxID=46160 RepID=A0ABP6CZP1_9ACTN